MKDSGLAVIMYINNRLLAYYAVDNQDPCLNYRSEYHDCTASVWSTDLMLKGS